MLLIIPSKGSVQKFPAKSSLTDTISEINEKRAIQNNG